MATSKGGTKVVGTKTMAPGVRKMGRSFGGSKMKGGYKK